MNQATFLTLGQMQRCCLQVQEEGICLHVARIIIPNLLRNNKFRTQKALVLAEEDEGGLKATIPGPEGFPLEILINESS